MAKGRPRERLHSRYSIRSYGSVTGVTVDECGRCGITNAVGVSLVKPDGTGRLSSMLDLCGACSLEVVEEIVLMVNRMLVRPTLRKASHG